MSVFSALRSAFGGKNERVAHEIASEVWPLQHDVWMLDAVQVTTEADGQLRLRAHGWAIAGDGSPAGRTILVNGQVPTELDYPLSSAGVAEVLWDRPMAKCSRFTLSHVGPQGAVSPDGLARLDFATVNANDGQGTTSLPRPAAWPKDSGLWPDLPEEAQRFRVIGNTDAAGFKLSGATDYLRLDTASRRFAKRALVEHSSILDWGVGCGRVARYVSCLAPDAFHGCDIDHANVDWCAGHLPGKYEHSDLHPPLPYPDAHFDVIYGISVFTHLREPLQDEWLAELARVSRPGAIALMTIHGPSAVEFACRNMESRDQLWRAIVAAGLFESSSNSQLDGAVENPDEYVNVYHDPAYVRRRWSKWFEVVEILPGYVFTHDLVVLRKR